jgi:hypothetical protein
MRGKSEKAKYPVNKKRRIVSTETAKLGKGD